MGRVVARGQDALDRASDAMNTHQFGPVDGYTPSERHIRIEVGTYDEQRRIFILGQNSGEIYILNGLELTASPQGEFFHGYFVGEVAEIVYQRTKWVVPVGQAVMGF